VYCLMVPRRAVDNWTSDEWPVGFSDDPRLESFNGLTGRRLAQRGQGGKGNCSLSVFMTYGRRRDDCMGRRRDAHSWWHDYEYHSLALCQSHRYFIIKEIPPHVLC